MKVNTNTITNKNNITFSGLYNNKYLLKSLRLASKNGALFSATTALVLSTVARPIAIMSTPRTDKENKKHACAKSIASTLVGYGIMLIASNPIASAVQKIDNHPQKYITKQTILNLKNGATTLTKSKSYMLATQIFKLGIGLAIALPKSALTCALITPILNLFPKQKQQIPQPKENRASSNVISFKGLSGQITEQIAKCIGKIINKKPLQEFAKKYKDSNFAQHIMSLTDVVLTTAFVTRVKNDKNIKNSRKKPLIHNSIISTGLCLTGGYAINRALKTPTEKFIENFKKANKELPELEKYVEGIKIAKPALILGIIYYIFIPVISTFLADRTGTKMLKN